VPNLTLYFAPGTCARVPMVALEELGLPYTTYLVRFMLGEQRTPAYRKLNPRGKVPTLLVDEEPLSENIAILTYLARLSPVRGLLPLGDSPMRDAQIISMLSWCASGLHPIVTRMRFPQFFCDVPGTRERVREMAIGAMKDNFGILEDLLRSQTWMLGEWSIIDAYIYWIWFRATGSGFDGASYPGLADHARRMEQRPSVQRMLARDSDAETELEADGLAVDASGVALPPRA